MKIKLYNKIAKCGLERLPEAFQVAEDMTDENGNIVDGDAIMYIYGCYMKERGKLLGNKIVTTVMSNFGLYKALDAKGIEYEKTAVGDKYVYENMIANGYRIGGEQSGHIIFLEHTTTGDGVMSSLQLVKAMLKDGRTMAEMSDEIKIYPQVLVNARIRSNRSS